MSHMIGLRSSIQRERLGAPLIHLFVYACWSGRMPFLVLYHYSTAPCTCKGNISATVIVLYVILQG